MRVYELVYIFDPALGEDAVNAKIERFHEVATRTDGAEVLAIDHWGARQLAYPIANHNTGYYVVAHVRANPTDLPELERLLKLDLEVMRYLVVVNEGEPIGGESVMSIRPVSSTPRDDDEEEEEDDEDEDEEIGEGDEAVGEGPSRGPAEFSGGKGRRRRVEGPAIEILNYKDVGTLSKFMTEQGKILPKRTTKVTAAFQRKLGRAVKRARFLSLVPYVRDHEA
jgi:small subunit ribosomal protein S6